MNETWKTFIRDQGAVLDDNRVRHFGRPDEERRAAVRGDILADLSLLSLIRARGDDTQTFLNGQLSNDVRLLDDAHSQFAAWCNPRGRMFAVFRLFRRPWMDKCRERQDVESGRRESDYFLQLPAALQENILKRLRMFVLRAKVALENADNELVAVGLSGPAAGKMLRETAGFAPSGDGNCETRDEITVISLSGPYPRFEIIAPPVTAMKLWDSLKSKAVPAGPPVWAWLDIMAGIPSVLPETSEEFVPQMANLELIGGVNFKKGCYPGQEIVARMQYLGKLKQRMYRAHVADEVTPRPGAAIYAPDFPGQSAGMVVDAQPAPEGGYDLLAVIQIGSVAGGELHLGSETGPRLALQPLPYSIPTGG